MKPEYRILKDENEYIIERMYYTYELVSILFWDFTIKTKRYLQVDKYGRFLFFKGKITNSHLALRFKKLSKAQRWIETTGSNPVIDRLN
jgi:hypothetical protein